MVFIDYRGFLPRYQCDSAYQAQVHTNSGSNRGTVVWLVDGAYNGTSLTVLRLLLQVMVMNGSHCNLGIERKGCLVLWCYMLCLFVD